MSKQRRTYYLIERRHVLAHQTEAILDMMRYDGSRVENNPPAGYYLFSTESKPCVDRWRSFSINISYVCGTADEAYYWAQSHKAVA